MLPMLAYVEPGRPFTLTIDLIQPCRFSQDSSMAVASGHLQCDQAPVIGFESTRRLDRTCYLYTPSGPISRDVLVSLGGLYYL